MYPPIAPKTIPIKAGIGIMLKNFSLKLGFEFVSFSI
jgi:hypothetical protein